MTPATKNPRLIAYYRVSAVGDREGASFQSFDQQRESAHAIVSLTPGASIVDEIEAPNASGGKVWPEPKLAAAIKRVDAGEADGIVVYSLDRWGRHFDALKVIEQWTEDGKTLLSASDKFDASTASGRMCLRMMMTVARFYWESSKERFATSQKNAIQRGVFVGPTPFGYTTTKGEKLTPDPTTAPIVREAFKLAAKDGLHAAMSYLTTAAPEKRWRTDETRRLLSARVYLGEVHLGELSNTDAHDALTTIDRFNAAQTEARSRRSNGDYMLSGIAECGKCSSPMVGALQSVHGKRYRRMRCSNPACRGGSSISADKLETYVRATLTDALGNAAFRVRFAVEGLTEAQEALEKAESERTRFAADLDMRDLLGDEAWRTGAKARVEAVRETQERYQTIARQAARSEDLPSADQMTDAAQLLRAVRAMVGRIVVLPGRGSVIDRVGIYYLNV